MTVSIELSVVYAKTNDWSTMTDKLLHFVMTQLRNWGVDRDVSTVASQLLQALNFIGGDRVAALLF